MFSCCLIAINVGGNTGTGTESSSSHLYEKGLFKTEMKNNAKSRMVGQQTKTTDNFKM